MGIHIYCEFLTLEPMGLAVDPDFSILVVDDDLSYCDALSRLLGMNYNVFTANTIREAYEMIVEVQFGMVIIDFDLRDRIDGIQFAGYVKTIAPLSYTLMLTGNSDFLLVQRALNEGNIDKFLIKPFDTQELTVLVDQSMANYAAKREISQMLQSADGIKIAQSLLTQVFDETQVDEDLPLDLSGIVISKNSIPLYSKFLNKEVLNNFTDTIFSGFMTAIHMVGKEVFTEDSIVDAIKFGQGLIYFQFYQSYQFCFILQCKDEQIPPAALQEFDGLVDRIVSRIMENSNYFNAKNQYLAEIDDDIEELISRMVKPTN